MTTHYLPTTHASCGGLGCRDCQDGDVYVRVTTADLRADEVHHDIRNLLHTTDWRVTGRIGADKLFGDACDDCGNPSTVLIETVRELPRGAEREGYQHCLSCAPDAINELAADMFDEISVRVPARLLPATDYAA